MIVEINLDLKDLAYDFRQTAHCLTQLINRLEKVVGSSAEPLDLDSLDTLYSARDAALKHSHALTMMLDRLGKKNVRPK